MVNLSIDPPPFSGRSRGGEGSGALRSLVILVVTLLIGGAGGFILGRKTAHGPDGSRPAEVARAPGGERTAAAPSPSSLSSSAPAGRGTTGAPDQASQNDVPGSSGAAHGSVAGGMAAQPPASATPPGAPQGPLVRRIAVVLRGPLEESVNAALSPAERSWGPQLTQVMNRILVWNMQIGRDARKGDRLEVLYELPTARPSEVQTFGESGPSTKEPILLALRYGSQKLGKLLTAYRFKPEGAPFARYYTAEGNEVEEHLVDSPIEGYEQITSLLRDGRKHKGVDFKTPVGTAVKSPFDGQITRRNWHFSANGNCIEVADARTGRRAIFLHLEAAPKEMQPGRKVRKGEVIAKSGNSGHSTAPHLHYQLEEAGGKVLDPFAVLPTNRLSLEGKAKSAFEEERKRLDPMLVAGR